MLKHQFKPLLVLLLCILAASQTLGQGRYTVSGFVREQGSRETLIGVNVFVNGTSIGTSTNTYGFYSLTLPADSIELVFSSVGFQPKILKIGLFTNIELHVELGGSLELEEVVVYGEMDKTSSRSPHMSVMEVPIRQIKSIPALLGEKDALKVIQLMPGVQKGSEGSSGLYVRGGGPDQNLIILDDATVYNAFHLFGFFSLFNGDALKSMEITKGGFPARFGGRLSSVLEITMKDGNKERFAGEAGIGILSSRLVVEGPIVKQKASFLVSARRTYFDLLIYPFLLATDFRGGYYFHDFTAKTNWEINPRNRVFLSGYFGRDKFYGSTQSSWSDEDDESEVGMFWENATTTLRWNRMMTSRLFSNLSLIYSSYGMNIYAIEKFMDSRFEMRQFSGIRDLGFKYDFTYYPSASHTLRFGAISTWHRFNPSSFVLKDDFLGEAINTINYINTYESGLYIEDEMKVLDIGIVNAGLRLSHFMHRGSQDFNLEPRVSGSFFLNDVTSIKASYARMNQYVHLLSTTGVGLPTDLWVPATSTLPYQKSWQTALGLSRDLPKYATTLTLEGYYKESDNIITYRDGANFMVIDDPTATTGLTWEDNVTSGRGWSYGLEMMLHKKSGRFTGWVGYTLSWTRVQFDEKNNGEPYYARHDRRHDVSIVGTYELNERFTLSATWVYGTGNAITLPLATYPIRNNDQSYWYASNVSDYGEINGFRMAPYHRFDLGVQYHSKRKWFDSTLEFGVYNLYNRKNPFFYYIQPEYRNINGEEWMQNKLKQVSIFPLIPSISYAIKF